MEVKYKRMVTELLESYNNKLTDWERDFLQSILERDEKKDGNYALSIKQKSLIDDKKLHIIDGITDQEERKKKMGAPQEYDNCKLITDEGVYKIEVLEKIIDVPVTKTEGVIILAYLDKAIPELMNGQYTNAKKEELSEEDQAEIEAAMTGDNVDPDDTGCPF